MKASSFAIVAKTGGPKVRYFSKGTFHFEPRQPNKEKPLTGEMYVVQEQPNWVKVLCFRQRAFR